MGILVCSLLWLMQDLHHQPYDAEARAIYGLNVFFWFCGSSGSMPAAFHIPRILTQFGLAFREKACILRIFSGAIWGGGVRREFPIPRVDPEYLQAVPNQPTAKNHRAARPRSFYHASIIPLALLTAT